MESVRQLEFGNRSRRQLVLEPRVRRAAKEKECRALMVSPVDRPEVVQRLAQLSVRTDRRNLRHNSTSRRSSSSPVARLPRPITARHKDSQKAGSRDNQKKRHRHGHNNFGAITPAAPE